MHKSRSLLLSTLVEKGACNEQVTLFKQRFGIEVQVTEELALSMASVFDWNWASYNLLSRPALKEYNKVYDPSRKEYYKICDSALKEYYKICDSSRKEYDKVRAITFANLYIKEM